MNEEKYIGYGIELKLPSGRVGLELTLNDLTALIKAMETSKRIKILVLPVKPQNVKEWRTHSVKVGESKYRKELIDEH